MNIFNGHVTVEDHEVPVVIGVDDTLRLLTNGTEIAQWSQGEFFISHDGDGVYTIVAENEALRFIPSQPDLFAHWVRSDTQLVGKHEASRIETPSNFPALASSAGIEMARVTEGTTQLSPTNRILFYLLVAGTSALGIWALTGLIA